MTNWNKKPPMEADGKLIVGIYTEDREAAVLQWSEAVRAWICQCGCGSFYEHDPDLWAEIDDVLDLIVQPPD